MKRRSPGESAACRLCRAGLQPETMDCHTERFGRALGGCILLTGVLLTFAAPVPAANFADLGPPIIQRTLNGIANGDDEAVAVAVDPQGDLIAAGFLRNFGSRTDFTVAKFDPDGVPLWQRTLHGTADGDGRARSVAVDRQGNIFVAGSVTNRGTGADFTAAKLSPDGALLWQKSLHGTTTGDAEARGVAVDGQGNIIAAGFTTNAGTGVDLTVAKLDPDGGLLWQKSLHGTAEGVVEDFASAVAVDAQGNVLVAGTTRNTGMGADFTVAKLSPDGLPLWQKSINGTANGSDGASAVAVDSQGNVAAAGFTTNEGTGFDFTVARYSPGGDLLWQKSINGTANSADIAVSVAVDGPGNVIAAGTTRNAGTGGDFTVMKFNPDGVSLWQQALNGTSSGDDFAASVAVDGQGNAVAAGSTANAGADHDMTVAKFGPDGLPLWVRSFHGSANGFNEADSVAVDAQGNIAAAGRTQNDGANLDFTAAKLDPEGDLLWVRTLDGNPSRNDNAAAVAVDAQGNVVAAGFCKSSDTSLDFTLAKFSSVGERASAPVPTPGVPNR
jgi:uncharacterized delta-60 repeat protein